MAHRRLCELLWLLATAAPALLVSPALAQDAFPPSTAIEPHDAGCVHMPIFHRNREQHGNPSRRAVQLPFSQRFDVGYYTRLSFGNPPQEALVHLDTGSFELWINPTCSVLSAGERAFCQTGGNYDWTKSSTAEDLGTTNQLRYGIGAANISYVRDTIGIPGTNMQVNNAQFGVATASEQQNAGILGIGHGVGQTIKYKNFIDELRDQNVTKTKAFSVALGGKDEKQGIVVFGGVDTSKFAGRLARLPIIPAMMSPDGVRRYWVQMQSLTLNPPSRRARTYNNSRMAVFLDTGSTLTLLPEEMVKAIASDFGSTAMDAQGYWPVNCDLTRVNGTLDFAFDNITIRVPYKELIRSFNGNCVLGLSSNSNFVLLGDTFLRSAYMVFDQDADCIWMSQYVNCGASPGALQTTSSLRTLEGQCSRQFAGSGAGSAAVSPPTPSGTSPAMKPPSTITSTPANGTRIAGPGGPAGPANSGPGRPVAGWGAGFAAILSLTASLWPLLV
ncbi:hypothetical protein RB597_007682 [Gaeumannomyces tritici]